MFSSVEKAEKADQVVKIKVFIGNGRGMRPWGAKQKALLARLTLISHSFKPKRVNTPRFKVPHLENV